MIAIAPDPLTMNCPTEVPSSIELALWQLPGFCFSWKIQIVDYEQVQAAIFARHYDAEATHLSLVGGHAALECNMTIVLRAVLFYAQVYSHFSHRVFFDAVSSDTFLDWPIGLAPNFVQLLANGRKRFLEPSNANRNATCLLADLVDRYVGLDKTGSDPKVSSHPLPKDEEQIHQLWKCKRQMFKHILAACPQQLLDWETDHLTAPTPPAHQSSDIRPSLTTSPNSRATDWNRKETRFAWEDLRMSSTPLQQNSPPNRSLRKTTVLKRRNDDDQTNSRPAKLRKQLDTAQAFVVTLQDNPNGTVEVPHSVQAEGVKELRTIKAELQTLMQRDEEARTSDANTRKAHEKTITDMLAEIRTLQARQQEFEKKQSEWAQNLGHQRIEAALFRPSPHHVSQSAGSVLGIRAESFQASVTAPTVSPLSKSAAVPTKCPTLEELSQNLAQEATTRARHIKKIDGVVNRTIREKLAKVTKRGDVQQVALDAMNRKINSLERQHLQAGPSPPMALGNSNPEPSFLSPPLPSTKSSQVMTDTDKTSLLDKLHGQECRLEQQEMMLTHMSKRIDGAVSRVDVHEMQLGNFEDLVKSNHSRIMELELDRDSRN